MTAHRGRSCFVTILFIRIYLLRFAYLKGDQLELYEKIFKVLQDQVPTPDLVVYLYADVNVLMNRIALRDRPFERSMDRNYISMLSEAYEKHMCSERNFPVLRIDTSSMDFVRNQKDLYEIFERIEASL
jgi:deoxyguanosine kinase